MWTGNFSNQIRLQKVQRNFICYGPEFQEGNFEIHPLLPQQLAQLKSLNPNTAHLRISHLDLKQLAGLIVTSQILQAESKKQFYYPKA